MRLLLSSLHGHENSRAGHVPQAPVLTKTSSMLCSLMDSLAKLAPASTCVGIYALIFFFMVVRIPRSFGAVVWFGVQGVRGVRGVQGVRGVFCLNSIGKLSRNSSVYIL